MYLSHFIIQCKLSRLEASEVICRLYAFSKLHDLANDVLLRQIILAAFFPSVSSRFMHYGARSQLEENDKNSIKRSGSVKRKNDENNGIIINQKSPYQKESQNQKSNYKKQQHASILDSVAAKRLPHDYFTHFYIFSLACLLFWAYQILTGGFAIGYMVSLSSLKPSSLLQPTVTMPPSRILLGWTLLFIQSVRRLGESLILASKPSSSSSMWIGHYIVGLTFYLLVNPAVYIVEALPTLQALLQKQQQQQQQQQQKSETGKNPPGEESSHTEHDESALIKMTSIPDIKSLATTILSRPIASAAHAMSAMCLRTAILLPLFILASALQHDAHMHLASIKDKSMKDAKRDGNGNDKEISSARSNDSNNNNNSNNSKNTYSLPTHPLFSRLIAPHYTLEVAIYIIIALLVAPDRLEGTLVTQNNSSNDKNENTFSSSPSSIINVATTTTLHINYTVAAAAIFAAVNLGVTAAGTRQWYAARFGQEAALFKKWTLVPFIW